MIGELVQVALNVAGSQCRATVCEDGIHAIPCQQGTVVAICHIIGQSVFRESSSQHAILRGTGHRGYLPVGGLYE